MLRILTVVALMASLAGLGGCVVGPAPGYYGRPGPGYVARPAYRPYYRRW